MTTPRPAGQSTPVPGSDARPPMLRCGHAANATHRNVHNVYAPDHPTCAICAPSPDACEIIVAPDLTGRLMTCTYGGPMTAMPGRYYRDGMHLPRPSDPAAAFFEYRGEGSPAAALCICGRYPVAHPETGRRVPVDHEYTPRGPWDTDLFYCGCWGWD